MVNIKTATIVFLALTTAAYADPLAKDEGGSDAYGGNAWHSSEQATNNVLDPNIPSVRNAFATGPIFIATPAPSMVTTPMATISLDGKRVTINWKKAEHYAHGCSPQQSNPTSISIDCDREVIAIAQIMLAIRDKTYVDETPK